MMYKLFFIVLVSLTLNAHTDYIKYHKDEIHKEFYGKLIYKTNRTEAEDYLVQMYLSFPSLANVLYYSKYEKLLECTHKELVGLVSSAEIQEKLAVKLNSIYSSSDALKLKAYHEAGHLLLLAHLKNIKKKDFFDSIQVYINIRKSSENNVGGAVQYNQIELMSADEFHIMQMITLGGMAAEQIIYGEHYNGSLSDLTSWNSITHEIIKLYPEFIREKKYCDIDNYTVLPNTKIQSRLNNIELRKFQKAQLEKVKIFLLKNKDLLDYVAKVLIENFVIPNKDIQIILKKVKF